MCQAPLSFILLLLPLQLAPALAGGQDSLLVQAPGGIAFSVTADGLSSIRLGDREVAKGGWRAINAEWMFGLGSRKVDDKLVEKSIEVVAPNRARVRHVQKDMAATFDYAFDGEDVTIVARVENNHPTEELAIPGFGGLRFVFNRPPTGLMLVWHYSYLAHIRREAFHPSHPNRVGGSYATDDAVGIGLTPLGTGLQRTFFFWDYVDWNPGRREKIPERLLYYLRGESIPPQGARTFAMKLRVSPDRDWKHLLQPYKDHFLATFGPVQYRADQRLVAVAHVNRNIESISKENPYGFHGGFRRLDLAEGVKAFCGLLIPALKEANGQGVILWGQGGENPRGAMYRPDFDILPPEVEANWPTLAGRFKEAGLRLGVTARPGEFAYRIDWKTDGTLRLNADDPAHLEMQWRRFKNMIDKGCTLFYLDSFGNSADDVKIMRYLRGKMGPEIQTFVEHQCDAVMPYSGAYSETDFWEKGSAAWAKESSYAVRSGIWNWEFYQWLLPSVQMISRLYDVHGKIPPGFEPVARFFVRNHISPMIEDFTLPGQAKELRAMQEEHREGGRKE